MRAARFAALSALCAGIAVAQMPVSTCDDEYECIYQASTVDNITFSFDLRPLCETGQTYTATDSTGHTYSFNICGTSSFQCIPQWQNIYQTGVAVQYWGSAPPCNATTPNCTDYNGNNVCCTQNCQVLGVGFPNWQLKQPSNPESGGLLITHIGVPPSDEDPFWCPWNPNTGAMYERTVTYDFTCNFSMPLGQVNVLGVSENSTNPCWYTIYLSSFHGCGCSPNCANRNCGADGCGQFCGNPDGECPFGYNCLDDGVCCQPDCNGRECGSDGCGGHCGNPTGTCGVGELCVRNQCVPNVTPTPSASKASPTSVSSATPSPPPPYYVINPLTDPGSVAFAFFGGMLTAGLLGLCIPYLYRKRTGTYVPYSTGVSREPLASPGSAYSVPATTGAYGGGFGGGGYNSDKPTTAATSGGYGTL